MTVLFPALSYSHIDGIESSGSVLPHSIPPVVRMNPEVVKRAAEDPELLSVQLEPVSLIGNKSGLDVAVVAEVLIDGDQLLVVGHPAVC